MSKTQTLTDVYFLDPSSYKVLDESQGDGRLRIRGVFQRADEVNGNGRVYPRSVLETQITEKLPDVKARGMFGELDHPRDGGNIMEISRASHVVTGLQMSESGEVVGEFEVLNGPYGAQLRAIIEAGGRIGISSRGLGSLTTKNGHSVVNEDFNLLTFDVVGDPSTKGAWGSAVVEANEAEENKGTSMNQFENRKAQVAELIRTPVEEMSVSERKRVVREAEGLISSLETEYLTESGYKSLTEALIDRLRHKIDEVTTTDVPAPAAMVGAAEQVVEALLDELRNKNEAIAKLRTAVQEQAQYIESANEYGDGLLQKIEEQGTFIADATAIGDRLLERLAASKTPRRKTTKTKSRRGGNKVSKYVAEAVRRNPVLELVAEDLAKSKTVKEAQTRVQSLLQMETKRARRRAVSEDQLPKPRKVRRVRESRRPPVAVNGREADAVILEGLLQNMGASARGNR